MIDQETFDKNLSVFIITYQVIRSNIDGKVAEIINDLNDGLYTKGIHKEKVYIINNEKIKINTFGFGEKSINIDNKIRDVRFIVDDNLSEVLEEVEFFLSNLFSVFYYDGLHDTYKDLRELLLSDDRDCDELDNIWLGYFEGVRDFKKDLEED